jgi:hypothetical protein
LLDDCRALLAPATEEFERFKRAVEIGGWVSQASESAGIDETIGVQPKCR